MVVRVNRVSVTVVELESVPMCAAPGAQRICRCCLNAVTGWQKVPVMPWKLNHVVIRRWVKVFAVVSGG